MIPAHAFRQDPDGVEGIDCLDCNLRQDHKVHEPVPLPDLPYAGTSGWAGSETSMERAVAADLDGTTTERQATALTRLATAGHRGLTWRELAEPTGWHHGQSSGVLSVLHKQGRIARLTERRDRCQVYVLPQHVGGRDVAAHGRRRAAEIIAAIEEACTEAEDAADGGWPDPPDEPYVPVSLLRALINGED